MILNKFADNLCFSQQFGILLERLFNQRRLFRSQLPVALFHRFGQPGKLQMCIGVARSVQQMLEPRPPGNSIRIEPVRLHLQELLI